MEHPAAELGLPCELRLARAPDAATVAAVHVESWTESYRGLLPPEVVRAGAAERGAAWAAQFAEDPPTTATVLAEIGGAAVGFVSVGGQRDPMLGLAGYGGEIRALHLLRRAQGRGIGAVLLRAAAGLLTDVGIGAAALWTLAQDRPARAFYERQGGVPVASRRSLIRGGGGLDEVAYGWPALEALL